MNKKKVIIKTIVDESSDLVKDLIKANTKLANNEIFNRDLLYSLAEALMDRSEYDQCINTEYREVVLTLELRDIVMIKPIKSTMEIKNA